MTNLSPEERDEIYRQARIQSRSGRKSGWISGDGRKGDTRIHVGWKWSAVVMILLATGLVAVLGGAMTMDLARLSETTTIAVDGAAWDIMTHAQFVGDKIGLESMEKNGQVFTLPEGTRVRIVGLGLSGAKIRVLNGDWTGQTGWVNRDFLSW